MNQPLLDLHQCYRRVLPVRKFSLLQSEMFPKGRERS
jgi:hypothetical protein